MVQDKPNEMTSLSQVMTKVENDGYKADFTINEHGKVCVTGEEKEFEPSDLIIDKVFRFEGESDPADMSILYAISANDGTKGKLVDAYGAYDSNRLADFLKNVKMADDANVT